MAATSGPRNRTAGHSWEREIATLINAFETLPEVGTSRDLSTYFDSQKIDIVTKVVHQMDEFELAIQAKTVTTSIGYPKLLLAIKENVKKCFKTGGIPVIFHKQTQRVNNRFMPRGKFAILFMEDFLKIFVRMVAYRDAYKLLIDYFDTIPDEDKQKVHDKLVELGL